jgi:3-isopropylmalate/(R)-2-methylmalate dehydratase small subunit
MEPFRIHTGIVALLNRTNVDTDQIIPKQFLKRIERTGFGQFLFFDWRFRDDGSPKPEFELNDARFRGASILLSGENFGCGSSREHAPWALRDFGFRVIVAPSFADIFYNNCFKNGILPVRLPSEQVQELFKQTASIPGYQLTVDLHKQTIRDDLNFETDFEVEDFRKEMLLNGLDEIGMTLQQTARITEFESRRVDYRDLPA